LEFSGEFTLSPDIIEKDYVLGWLLAGVAQSIELGDNWVFKGGTCLKKCYFETYRFSEDLDFTLRKAEQQDSAFLVKQFREITTWIYSAAGIQFPPELIKFEVYRNPRGMTSVQGKIGYLGPLQRGGNPPRVKLDLTADEVLVLDPCIQEVSHPYSDRPDGGINIRCYCFEEIFAEKVRALAERLRPRDLYDVIHLYRHDATNTNALINLT
jgi:predicted nucleotidyltransferase component of viral defense system